MSSNVMDIFLSVKIDEETDDLHRTLSTLREIVNLQTIATSLGDDVKIKADTDDIEEKIKEIKELIKSDDDDDDSGVSDQIKNIDFKLDAIVTDVDFMRSNLFMLSSPTRSPEFIVETLTKRAIDPSKDIANFISSSSKDPGQFERSLGKNPEVSMEQMYKTMLINASDMLSKGPGNKYTQEVLQISDTIKTGKVLAGSVSTFLTRFKSLFFGHEDAYQKKVTLGSDKAGFKQIRKAKGVAKGEERIIGMEQSQWYGLVGEEKVVDLQSKLYQAKILPDEKKDLILARAQGKDTKTLTDKIIARLRKDFLAKGGDEKNFNFSGVMFAKGSIFDERIMKFFSNKSGLKDKDDLKIFDRVKKSIAKQLRPDWMLALFNKFYDDLRDIAESGDRQKYVEKEIKSVYGKIEPLLARITAEKILKEYDKDPNIKNSYAGIPFKNLLATLDDVKKDYDKERWGVPGSTWFTVVPPGARTAVLDNVYEIPITSGVPTLENIEQRAKIASFNTELGTKRRDLQDYQIAARINEKEGKKIDIVEEKITKLIKEVNSMAVELKKMRDDL